jgi:hypothetical protein
LIDLLKMFMELPSALAAPGSLLEPNRISAASKRSTMCQGASKKLIPVPIQSEAHTHHVGHDSGPTSREITRTVFYISAQALLSRRRSRARRKPRLRRHVCKQYNTT